MSILEQTTDPIIWQEVNHQERSAPRFVGYWLVGPLIIALMIIGVALTLTRIDYPTRELALYVIWIVHATTAVRAIAAGGNAISREHVGQTWDALVLTGISTRQILIGKWRAAMRRVAPWVLALGVLRLAMLPIFTLALVNRFAWRNLYFGYGSYYYEYQLDFGWVAWAAIVAVGAAVALTLLEIMACTALGIAASALTRRGALAMISALCIRFAPVAIFASFTRYQLGPAPTYMVLRFTPFAIADSGTSPLAQLVLPLMPWTQTIHTDVLPGLFIATAVMIGFLVISLAVAWYAIRQMGALPHPKVASVGTGWSPRTTEPIA